MPRTGGGGGGAIPNAIVLSSSLFQKPQCLPFENMEEHQ